MAQLSSAILGRHVARSVRPVVARAPFTSTSLQSARRAPSLADIPSANADSFDKKQKDFRSKLDGHRDNSSRFPPEAHPTPPASSSPASTTGPIVHGDDALTGAQTKHGLGSLSSATDEEDPSKSGKKDGVLKSIIYGTEEGREHDRQIEHSFSQVLARGKYVHSITFHEVKPDKVDEYVELIGSVYPNIANDPRNKVNLVGSFRTEIGDNDTFVHIWEYQQYHGFHESWQIFKHHPDWASFQQKMNSLINARKTSLMQEFSFWPTTPPRKLGGLFELRSYELHPGNLLEWETHWRQGLKARREVMEGVGAWFVQIGDLNTVHHLWQFADLEERKRRREESWAVEGWSDTVHRTVPLIQTMKSRILIPMEWSPVA